MATKKNTNQTKKTGKKKPPASWRASFGARFPQYLQLIDGGAGEAEARKVFGDQLVDLIIDVAQNPDNYDFTTQVGLDAFNTKVFATPYYQQTSRTRKEFDSLEQGERDERVKLQRIKIASSYGDLGLTVRELDRLAKETARSGLDGLALTQYVNSSVGGRARGREDLLASIDSQEVQKIARAYGYNPSDLDDQVMSVITGKEYAPTGTILTTDSIREMAKMTAKSKYFHLSQQLDSGLTLESMFAPYKQLAARILEKSEDNISMDDPLFANAFGTSQNGQPSLGDWERTIRSDPRYGFQYTETAKRDATSLGLTIARAFGKLR
jgi:hypothetical protein